MSVVVALANESHWQLTTIEMRKEILGDYDLDQKWRWLPFENMAKLDKSCGKERQVKIMCLGGNQRWMKHVMLQWKKRLSNRITFNWQIELTWYICIVELLNLFWCIVLKSVFVLFFVCGSCWHVTNCESCLRMNLLYRHGQTQQSEEWFQGCLRNSIAGRQPANMKFATASE